jgi:hypothetical protein
VISIFTALLQSRVFKLIPEAVNIIKPFRFAWAKERVIDLTVKKELLHELDCLV